MDSSPRSTRWLSETPPAPVFDLSGYGYLDEQCPATVNPSLFRRAQLVLKNGLYKVTDGIHQIRGFDLSNMTLVEGDIGIIVIDPLISAECAAAGLALYRKHRGERPVTGMIYTHSHGDHFGGVTEFYLMGAGLCRSWLPRDSWPKPYPKMSMRVTR